MASYSFTSVWQIEAPLEPVGLALVDVLRWPQWWPAVKRVETVKHVTENEGVGSIYRHTWQSFIPYKLIFTIEVTEVIPFKKIRGKASGDLEGWGTWTLNHQNGITTATY